MESPNESAALTLSALLAQPDNAGVWRYLNVRGPQDIGSFESNADGSPYDEGGQIFFHQYGRFIPAAARCIVRAKAPENLLAHERTARVFALHTGRFTIALRPDFRCAGLDLCGPLRGATLDGRVDLSALGPDWVLFHADGEDEAAELFLRAYLLAGDGARQADPDARAAPDPAT